VIAGYTGRLVCLCALWLLLLSPAQARAEAKKLAVTLEYSAAPGCPDAAALETVVVERLGYDPFADGAPDHIVVRITEHGVSLRGRIEWRDATGNWAGDQAFQMVSSDCLGLTRTMGLALAVQIQLLADARTPPQAEVTPPAETAPAPSSASAPNQPSAPHARNEPAAPAAVTLARLPSPGSRPAFALGAGLSVGFGMTPVPVPFGGVFGAVAWQHFSLELAAEVGVLSTTRRADGAGVSQQLLFASGAGCALLGRWSACVVANAGEVRLNGENVDRPTSARVPLVQVGGRVGVTQLFGQRAFLSAHADALLNLNRWTESLDDIPIWSAPRFAASIGVAAGVRFP